MVSDAVIKHIKTHTERSSDDQAAVDFFEKSVEISWENYIGLCSSG